MAQNDYTDISSKWKLIFQVLPKIMAQNDYTDISSKWKLIFQALPKIMAQNDYSDISSKWKLIFQASQKTNEFRLQAFLAILVGFQTFFLDCWCKGASKCDLCGRLCRCPLSPNRQENNQQSSSEST